jgi:glycosyltransferase involved in cell wall biosynthesis
MKITFIAWTRYHRRSELLAQHLGATIHYIQYWQPGKLLQVPVKYLTQALKALVRYPVQTLRTWRVLRRERPDVVFAQNPPIFCVLVSFIYARRYGAQYVIDSHTGAFLSPKWRWSLELHRVLSRRALMTIVHNKSQEKIVNRWGCRYCVLAFTPGDYPAGEHFPFDGQFNVAVISTFEEDEPLDVVFEAAGRLPEVNFYVTGDSKRIAPRLIAKKPDNCRLTGYLSYDRYVGLLRGVDVVIDLTDQDHTLLMGGFEAVSLGKPLITSDWPVLKDYFSLGTVHIPNTVEGVCEGVRRARLGHDTLQRDILRLRDQLENEWRQKLEELQDLLRGQPPRKPPTRLEYPPVVKQRKI